MRALCLSLPFHCVPHCERASEYGANKKNTTRMLHSILNCARSSDDSYAQSVIACLAGRAMTETLERSFVFSGTNEQFGRPLCVPWVIVLSNVPRSETFERNAIVLVESSFFFYACCCCCCFLWVLCRPLKWVRACVHKHGCTHLFFSISLSADSNESSVHLCLFCAEMLRLKSFSAD